MPLTEDRLLEILKNHIQGDPRNKTFADMLRYCDQWDIIEAMKEACAEAIVNSRN